MPLLRVIVDTIVYSVVSGAEEMLSVVFGAAVVGAGVEVISGCAAMETARRRAARVIERAILFFSGTTSDV